MQKIAVEKILMQKVSTEKVGDVPQTCLTPASTIISCGREKDTEREVWKQEAGSVSSFNKNQGFKTL